jgi:hypothetical protein
VNNVYFEVYDTRSGKAVLSFRQENVTEVYQQLASDLIAKEINHTKNITKIKRTNNYDGTISIVVYYDNQMHRRYVVKE